MTKSLLPTVLRARDFHLYLENGKRLTDLWLSGGRAILGHKPPMVVREMKNTAERGLFSPFPHPLEKRFVKALELFFPGRIFRLYNSESSLRAALAEAGLAGFDAAFSDPAFPSASASAASAADPAFPSASEASAAGTADPAEASANTGLPAGNAAPPAAGAVRAASLWRPFLPAPADYLAAPVLVPVLPWALGPAAAVLEKSAESSFPPGEIIPPVLLAPATRALYNLAAAIKAPAPNRGRPGFPKIEKIFERKEDSGGQKAVRGPWRRRGIYLTVDPEMDGEKYEALFCRFLEGGFLIPPSPEEPAILPASMSAGEEAALSKLLTER